MSRSINMPRRYTPEGVPSAGGNKPRHKTKKELAVDRMQPSPELGALFGVHVPTPDELARIRKEERKALMVESRNRKEKYR